jgi:hypothetical protein
MMQGTKVPFPKGTNVPTGTKVPFPMGTFVLCWQITLWAISRDILSNLGVKKVEAPSKYPEKWPIK